MTIPEVKRSRSCEGFLKGPASCSRDQDHLKEDFGKRAYILNFHVFTGIAGGAQDKVPAFLKNARNLPGTFRHRLFGERFAFEKAAIELLFAWLKHAASESALRLSGIFVTPS